MFTVRNKRPSIDLTRLSSLIAEDVVITGDLCFSGGLRIDGCVKGNLIAESADGHSGGLLVLSQKGRIEGRVHCADAVINGSVVGDLDVQNFLELQSQARVSGSIRYHQLQMEVGAAVRGELQDAQLPAAADNVVTLGADKSAATERR